MINLLGLIEMYNTYAKNTVFQELAASLLKHYDQLDRLSTQQIAELCNVSLSTLTRFYKMMDYPYTVSKLPEIVGMTKLNYSYEGRYYQKSNNNKEHSIQMYMDQLKRGMDTLFQVIDEVAMEAMIKEMIQSNKIIFLGCPMPQEVWRFQADLTLKGIESSAFLDPNHQYDAMNTSDNGVMVFYIHYCKPAVNQFVNVINKNRHKISKFIVLSSSLNHPFADEADYTFLFDGNDTEQDFILINIFMNLLGVKFKECVKMVNR